MGCSETADFVAKYYERKGYDQWNVDIFRWFSTTKTTPPSQYAFADITNSWDGIFTSNELYKLGNAQLMHVGGTSGGADNDITKLPYPDYLYPLDDYTSFVKNSKLVVLQKIQFIAYDVTDSSTSYQNQDVNSAIATTLSSATGESYVKTRFKGALPVDWIPNYFRPKFIINNNNVLSSLSNTISFDSTQTTNNKAYMAMGEDLPWEVEMNMPVNFASNSDSIDQIQVRAMCGQVVNVTGGSAPGNYIKRYPLKCRAIFTYV